MQKIYSLVVEGVVFMDQEGVYLRKWWGISWSVDFGTMIEAFWTTPTQFKMTHLLVYIC